MGGGLLAGEEASPETGCALMLALMAWSQQREGKEGRKEKILVSSGWATVAQSFIPFF